jgi:hypothetical protein
MWIGEILLDTHGKVSHVWTIRQARLTPPFPAVNNAILDAVRQWQFEPFVVASQPRPICITVTVDIDRRQSPKASPPLPRDLPRVSGSGDEGNGTTAAPQSATLSEAALAILGL